MFDFLTGRIFWGIVLVLWGISIFIEKFFNIKISLFRIILGLILIIIGVKLIYNQQEKKVVESETSFFSENTSVYNGVTNEYNIYFGNGYIDLSQLKQRKDLTVNVMFGNAELVIPDSMAIDLNIRNVMGETTLPDHSVISIGSKRIISNSMSKMPVKIYLNNTMATTKITGKLNTEPESY